MKKVVVDLFAGAGGESTGIMQAAELAGMDVELIAVNHWDCAINTHAKNHPEAQHYCESIDSVDPLKAVPGGHVDVLWASPECTHFSNARGGKPRADQSRASVNMILAWLSKLDVKRVYIENVREFVTWGPLNSRGQLLKSGKGEFFRGFIKTLQTMGYNVEWRILCAADYGVPTIRKRFFLQAVKKGQEILWPQQTHAEKPNFYIPQKWIPARDVIDFSIPSVSIFKRKKPLAENTIRRIETGIKRFWGAWAEPFLIVLRGTGTARSLQKPLPAVTCSGTHLGLIEPLILHQMSGGLTKPISEPLPTVTTICNHRIVEPFIMQYYGNGNSQPVSMPLNTITCKDPFALIDGNVAGFDIRLRMLKPHELAAAQGFPKEYVFTGTKTDQVKQIGNAVPPGFVKALLSCVWSREAERKAA